MSARAAGTKCLRPPRRGAHTVRQHVSPWNHRNLQLFLGQLPDDDRTPNGSTDGWYSTLLLSEEDLVDTMASNLDQYKTDLDALVRSGELLYLAIQYKIFPHDYRNALRKSKGFEEEEDIDKAVNRLPSFIREYQAWYSEAKVLIKQILPDRLEDFVRHYEKPRSRKTLTFENYRIADYLEDLTVIVSSGNGQRGVIAHVRQQLFILKAVEARFESSLFDMQQLVTADLFDSELDAASELSKQKFTRAAGALAGVVLEKHLGKVCKLRSLRVRKKKPTIGDYNDLLKKGNVVDIPTWRSIQYLGDLRNLCDHDRDLEPTPDQVIDLIAGVKKIIKTVF